MAFFRSYRDAAAQWFGEQSPKVRIGIVLTSIILGIVVIGYIYYLVPRPEKVMAPMADGTPLATEYLLPRGEGPFPVVLVRSLYGRNHGLAGNLNAHGAAYVIQDVRGFGESGGDAAPFVADGWGERQDGRQTVEWIRAQEWCNGKVGGFGASALGFTQILLAPVTDGLACQGVLVAPSKFYGQVSYQGGVWRKSLSEGWLEAIGRSEVIDEWRSHPTDDAYWAQLNAERQAARVTAPGIHVGGWWDVFQQGTINSFVSRQHEGGEGARGNQKLIIGPWGHHPQQDFGDIRLPNNFLFDFGAEVGRFFWEWLEGRDTGIMDEPAVRYYTLGDVDDPHAPGKVWQTAEDWPVPAADTPYYLTPQGGLQTQPAASAALAYTYDPADPCPTLGGANLLIEAGPMDQRDLAERADVLRFATDPLEEPVACTGRVKVRLRVSSSAPDTDFTAKLVDIYPDGREILLLDGIQRLKFRDGFETPEPLPPGDTGELTIDLWSTSVVFNRGHRIGVHISSSNYPRFEKNPNTGDDFPSADNLQAAENTLHLGGMDGPALILPIFELAEASEDAS